MFAHTKLTVVNEQLRHFVPVLFGRDMETTPTSWSTGAIIHVRTCIQQQPRAGQLIPTDS
jgi:hypothetical protein